MSNMIIELSEEIIESMSDKEVEILKLQKMMVRDLTRERDSFKNRIGTLIADASNHELEIINLESQLDSLTDRIAVLLDEKSKLEEIHDDSIRLDAYNSLQEKHDDISVKLDVNKQTLKTVITNSHELERKLADAQFKLGTATQQRDELSEQLKKISADHAFMTTRFTANESALDHATKKIRDLELDVNGFPIRLDNACKAAVKQYQDTHREQVAVKQTNLSQQSILDRKLIADLTGQLKLLKNNNASLSERCESLSILNKEKQELVDLADTRILAIDNANKEILQRHAEYKSYGKKCSELVANIHAQSLKYQRDLVYVTQMLDFFGGQKVYCDEKVTVFMLHNDFSCCFRDEDGVDDSEKPDASHPMFWAVHKNSLGHMFSLSKSGNNLLLPANLPKKYLIANNLQQKIIDVIKKIKIKDYVEALDRNTLRAKNIAQNVEYLDFNFADTFNRAKFVAQCVKQQLFTKDEQQVMEESIQMLNTLALNYSNRTRAIVQREARLVNGIKSKRKSKKRK